MSYDPERITFFAKTDARGQHVPFGIKAKDRTRHVYVIGKTGMGKSTLLENMAVQDMQHGNGLAFIDPHGATAETLLSYVPEHRVDDVLYFAPFDTTNPIAFNVMEDVGPERRHLVAAGLMSVFKKIWVDAWSARMEYILQNTLLALLEFPNSTLLGVNRMLSDKHYRQAVVDNIKDPAVKSFWVDEFANYNERYMQEAGDAIKNKIGQFTANPLIRNIIGQPQTSFDLRKMMDEKKILIANLSKGLIGEGNANLLGSMLTTRVYLAAMSRADLDPQTMKQMPNYYFYVDEFQSFANATFADILSEARKYHLNLTIAHQYIEQMEEEVRNAVFGNVGTMISFRVGPFDAEILETIFAPQFQAVDIVNLGFAQIYLTLMIDGIGSRPFSATTLPPIEAPAVSCRDMVVARSKAQFGTDRTEVETNINAWMAYSFAPERSKPAKNQSGSANHNGKAGEKKGGTNSSNNQPRVAQKSDSKANNGAARSAQSSQPAPAKPDLGELRSVLHAIAKDDTAGHDTTTAAPDAASTTPPAAAATKSTQAPSKRQPHATAGKREKGAAKQKAKAKAPAQEKSESASEPSLKAALAAVLTKHEDSAAAPAPAQAAQPATPAATTPPPPAPTTPPPTPTPPTATNAAAADAPPPATAGDDYRATKSKDTLDPKQIERMLRITTADNSPFKKRS